MTPIRNERKLDRSQPWVALESTVITHGLPHPQNLQLARDMEAAVRESGARPATVGIIAGEVRVGLSDDELEQLANVEQPRKVSLRDFASAMIKKEWGGTTVAATMHAAHRQGIRVFATGGIGGVHASPGLDISSDLEALASIPMLVVCAGAKAILDLPATLEVLETKAVPVIGYQTDDFPAFYSRHSGLPVSLRLDSPLDVVSFARAHWEIGMTSAVLVCQPLSEGDELPREKIGLAIQLAKQAAESLGISGQAVTPFLLSKLAELTGGESLRANLKLLLNNARLAAQLSIAWHQIRHAL